MAIDQGLTILSWFENCTKEELPPEYLWEDSEGLEHWWESVKDAREDGTTPDKPDRRTSDEDEGEWGDHDPGPGTAENDLARILKG